MNFYGNSTNLYDSYVTQISISCYEKTIKYQEGKRTTCPDFMLLQDIHKDSTVDDIITSLGDPDKIIIDTMYSKKSNHKNSLIQLYYNVKTSSIPNGRVVFNIRPVLDQNTPTDFLTAISFSLQ